MLGQQLMTSFNLRYVYRLTHTSFSTDIRQEGEEPSFVPSGIQTVDSSGLIPAIYTEDPALEPQWDRLNIRGVDDFHTNDILSLVNDYDPEAEVHIQWIDDTSANIVYKSKELAREGILKLTSQPTNLEDIDREPTAPRQAKTLASRPTSMLIVRIAQVGDRKMKNARDASRYYLLHPDEDPTERMRREFANGRGSREYGDYRRRKFDDREHRRRRDHDRSAENMDFTASMYDDAPSTEPEKEGRGRDLFSRITRRRSASPGAGTRNSDEIVISDSEDDGRRRKQRNGYRDRTERPPPYSRNDPAPFPKANTGKELFSSDSSKQEGGLHSDRIELRPSPNIQSQPRQPNAANSRATNLAAARRLKTDLMNAAQTSPRGSHRRSHAMDAKNEEDLAERFARKSISMDSTKDMNAVDDRELFPSSGMSIKGSANHADGLSIKGHGGLSIKGRASEVKELFPERYKKNEGKELFDEPVREKRVRRRAGDLFD